MRNSPFLLLPLILLCAAGTEAGESGADKNRLTTVEAGAIVEARMDARASAEAARREAIESRPASAEWESANRDGAGTRTIFRRVAPPAHPLVVLKTNSPRREITEEERSAFLRREAEAETKPRLNISLSATVFDGELTEIRLWHGGERYEVLSNVPFSYLEVIGSFEDETAEWSFFGMVHYVDAREEARFAKQAEAFGAEYIPRPRPDKSLFTSMEFPEYLVLAERDQVIPEDILIQLDAIHSYYLANEKALAVQYQRSKALAAAHRRWKEQNPPVEQDLIINFSPLQ